MANASRSYGGYQEDLLCKVTEPPPNDQTVGRRLTVVYSSTRPKSALYWGAGNTAYRGHSSVEELLFAKPQMLADLVAPVLLSLQRGDEEGQLACTGTLLMIARGHQDSAEQQAVRQELRKYAPQLPAAAQGLVERRPDLWSSKWSWSSRAAPNSWMNMPSLADIKRCLAWLLWEPVFDQPASAAAGSGQLLASELPPGCSLQWLPGSMQLLTPELLHCLMALAGSSDSEFSSFARQFLAQICGVEVRAALLKSPQQVHHLAPFAAAVLQAMQRARWQHDAAAGRVLYACVVQLLQSMMPLSGSRQGRVALAPHTQLLSKAATVLQSAPAAFAGEVSAQQEAACTDWAEQTAAAAAAALQEAKAQHAEALIKRMDTLVSGVAPAHVALRRSGQQQQHVALHKFITAAVEFGMWAAREEQLKELLQLAHVDVEA
uniref:Uncharacterized protein n=1 Tax=Tetradesmus obliquus TaxID=3088 RepID=A0A383VL03_TETOB|eukprot:jgi/Sobl393_1/18627/SZX65364.1